MSRLDETRERHAARLRTRAAKGDGSVQMSTLMDDDVAWLLAEVERLRTRLEATWTAGDRQAEAVVGYVSRIGRGAALADEWRCNCGGPSPEGTHEMHCDSYYGDALRTALAPAVPSAEDSP